MSNQTLVRFLEKIRVLPNGCWEWVGARTNQGYGHFRFGDKMHRTHRISYEMFNGPIPEGLHLDHLCRNRWCQNPAHLEAVTHRENCLRGESVWAKNARKTHCKRGHPLSGSNVKVDKKGGRHCRRCMNDKHIAYAKAHPEIVNAISSRSAKKLRQIRRWKKNPQMELVFA